MIHLKMLNLLILFVGFLILGVCGGEDFYQLLGLTKEATTREIRKAFKKKALTMHPDKNKEEDAHENFLRLNRAYEVLKDDDLRNKYDAYGEAGLKEDGPSGKGYQSWNFYNQNFGIYDDDAEIITLSRSDFETSVDNTDDVWFINFYSSHCSHCHDLAPTWREMARELLGVVRIGAVNCEDDWNLCRQKNVQSYPSLILYPKNTKYEGVKNKAELINFALKEFKVTELTKANFKNNINPIDKHETPWLIAFCSNEGDCLESITLIKISAILNGLVGVATLSCNQGKNDELCKKLGIDHSMYFFEAGKVIKGQGKEITSFDVKEITNSILELLPDMEILQMHDLEERLSDIRNSKIPALLLHFVEGSVKDLELKKLAAFLHDVKVGRVDCKLLRNNCNELHIYKFPTFALFKSSGGHEIYYGRHTAHDVAAFAKDSFLTPVRTLDPQDFPMVTSQKRPYFIDFFAPWCPPCMKLLPEFRKASKQATSNLGVDFGIVDCTQHQALCQQYNINSYPTTILFNQSKPHNYHGHHSSNEIVDFIEDLLNPSVEILDPSSFRSLVASRPIEETWLIDFFAPWCGPCQQLAPEWRKLAKMLKGVKNVRVAEVDCAEHQNFCQSVGVNGYPHIRLYPYGKMNTNNFHTFNSWFRNAESIRTWASEYLPSKVILLDDNKFRNKLLSASKPWVVDFYAPWCGHCQIFAPEFEKVAEIMQGRVRVAKINCDNTPHLCQMAGIQAYPSVRFYPGTTQDGAQQNAYGIDINSQNADFIIKFLEEKVPKKIKAKDEL